MDRLSQLRIVVYPQGIWMPLGSLGVPGHRTLVVTGVFS